MIAAEWLPTVTAAHVDHAVERVRGNGHLLVLLPEAEMAVIPLLQERCRAGGVALAGAVFPSLLVHDQQEYRGAIMVSVVGAPPPCLIPAADVDTAARKVCDYVDTTLHGDDTGTLLCIFDAMVPNIGSHLDAWYLGLANRVRYAGINAGNERFTPAPCLFDTDTLVGDSVLVQLLPHHPGAAVQHGFVNPDDLISATSADANRIVQIDWQPALEVYSRLIRERYGIVVDRDNFYTHAIQFPFGIVRADGEMLIRIPVALADDGSIACVGEIPPNSILALLDARNDLAPVPALLADDLAERAPERHGGDLLVFYCAGRRLYMGEHMEEELAEIARRTSAPQVLGALSLGEIGGARSGGYPLFHNAAVVGLPCHQH